MTMRQYGLLALALAAAASAATDVVSGDGPLSGAACVSSGDGLLTACVDAAAGVVDSVAVRGAPAWAGLNAGTALFNCTVAGVSVASAPTSVTITRTFACPGGHTANVSDALSAGLSSNVAWDVVVQSDSPVPFTAPIVHAFAFGAASEGLKLWAPWDRGSESSFPAVWVDPLQPSDVMPGGWWTGGPYKLGNVRGAADYITAGIWAVLSTSADVGFSLHASPRDAPMDFSFSCDMSGGLSWTREHYRLGGGTAPVRLHQDLVGHAADWRAALSFSVTAYAPYWEPENVDSFLMAAGTGSYSSFLGPYNKSEFDGLGYAVNWDLSGKFFPYMAMFLPPVATAETVWQCDPEGSQPHINVTFDLIGANYRAMWNAGFTDMSYFNVNEFGLNVVLPPPNASGGDQAVAQPASITRPGFASIERLRAMVRRELRLPGGSPATCEGDWKNASACLLSDLLPALVTHAYNTDSKRLVHGPWYSWQKAVVVDPGVAEYHAFMVEQMVRHVVHEDAFAGVAVDRSDWQDLYNCDLDDGVSFVPEAVEPGVPMGSGVCSSMRITYAAIVADLRTAMTIVPGLVTEERARAGMPRGAAPVGTGILLLNRYGNGRLDQYRHYDGLFSEGMAVNGAGLIAVATPGVLWTYDWTSCCSDEARARTYFQAHLFMGLCPMLPFPGNDHAIAPNATAAAFYSEYAPLLKAVAPKVWLLEAHVVAVVNGTSGTYAKVNAFVTPVLTPAQEAAARVALGEGGSGVGGAAPTEQAITLAVVFAGDPSGVVTLNLTGIDRAWRAAHPLLRAHKATGGVLVDAHGGGGGTAVYTAEVLWPGQGWAWAPLASFSTPSTLLQVPVVKGAAVVRIRAAAAAAPAEEGQTRSTPP